MSEEVSFNISLLMVKILSEEVSFNTSYYWSKYCLLLLPLMTIDNKAGHYCRLGGASWVILVFP